MVFMCSIPDCSNSKILHCLPKDPEAISCLKRALWLDPLNWRVLFNLGLCHLATMQPASAFNYACAAVNLRPDIADSFTILGVALLELKDPDNAVKAFRLALSLCPEDVYIVVNMALCCVLLGNEGEAIGLMERYGRLMENDAVCANELIHLADRLIAHVSLHFTNKEICDVSTSEDDIKTQAEDSKPQAEDSKLETEE